MTIVAIDGFDLYAGVVANTGLQTRWAIARTDYYTTTMQAGRFGGQAVQQQVILNTSGGALTRSFTGSATGSFGFAYKSNVIGAQAAAILNMYLGATSLFNLAGGTGGTISAYKAPGTQMGTTSAAGVMLVNTWQYVEIEWAIAGGTGVFNVWVDGVKVIAATGLTNNATGATVDTVGFITSSNGTTFLVDDFYWTIGAATRLGERRVETLRPTADTATKAWTPNSGTANFSRVFDATCDGDTTYVSATTAATADLYTIGALSSTPASVSAVQVTSFAEKTDATTRAINNAVTSGATASPGPQFPLPASYAKFERILETDPNTAAAWATAAVNALQIGPTVAV